MIRPATGTDRKVAKLKNATDTIQEGIKSGLRLIGRQDTLHAKRLIHDPRKTGRIYNYKGRKHQASAPGEAPANMSGALARSINYKLRGHQQVEIGTGMSYGRILELGSKKMKKRPFLSSTARDRQEDNIRVMRREIKKRFGRR